MQPTPSIGGAIAPVAVIRMMGGKEIPSAVDQYIRYARTQDSTGSNDSSGMKIEDAVPSSGIGQIRQSLDPQFNQKIRCLMRLSLTLAVFAVVDFPATLQNARLSRQRSGNTSEGRLTVGQPLRFIW